MNDDQPFSVRMGFEQPKPLQTDDLDRETRIMLYNTFDFHLKDVSGSEVWKFIGVNFFKMPHDDVFLPSMRKIYKPLYITYKYKKFFLEEKWHRIFDLIEFLYKHLSPYFKRGFAELNNILEKQKVGYRFVSGKFIPLIEPIEVDATKQAANSSYENAREHIRKTVNHLSARENPDYHNVIKEAISAVESLVREITGIEGFNKGVDNLEKKGLKMHRSFKEAMKELYGFTSDEPGIRHGKDGKPLQNIDHSLALFMLVNCSAFVNYLSANAPKK